MRITESQLRRIIRQEVARGRGRRVNEGRYGGYGYVDTYGEQSVPNVRYDKARRMWVDSDTGAPADRDWAGIAVDEDSGLTWMGQTGPEID